MVSFNVEEHSINGALGLTKSNPDKLIASFIGIGLVSANKALIKGNACN